MVLALFRRIAGAGNLLDSYSMISDQSIERSLWLVVSGADGGNQAEIKESPDSRGELLARQFSCSGDLILERSAARIASRPVFRLQRRQRGLSPLGCLGDGQINLHFRLPPELVQDTMSRALDQRARLRRSRFELRGNFSRLHSRGFH